MNLIRTRPLSRRTLLRGAGVALGLPWLEAMAPSIGRAATAQSRPVRMAALYMPNGAYPPTWTPDAKGRDFVLPYSLDPLTDLRDEDRRPQQSVERAIERRRRALRQGIRDPHLLAHQENARRGPAQWSFGRPGRGPAGRPSHSPALARVGRHAGGRRQRRRRRLHAGLRFAHFLELAHHAAGARAQSSRRLRAALPGVPRQRGR